MPRTTASSDDAGVGSTIPSTLANSSKGTEAIPLQKVAPAGGSEGGSAGTGDNRALVVGPLPKFTTAKKLSMKRAPA